MLYSTILAGGSGTRLWPLSRACEPKFLHPLTGTDRSLLQATADRIRRLSAADHIYVVTGTAHPAAGLDAGPVGGRDPGHTGRRLVVSGRVIPRNLLRILRDRCDDASENEGEYGAIHAVESRRSCTRHSSSAAIWPGARIVKHR